MGKKYYDISKVLSYNSPLTMVVGARGIGKTYAIKKWILNRYVKNGEKFLMLSRHESDFKEMPKEHYFGDLERNGDIPPEIVEMGHIEVFGSNINIVGEDGKKIDQIGYFVGLATSQKLKKDASIQDYTNVLFDEFLNMEGRYLKNEVNLLIELYNTIDRDRDVTRMFLLSNYVSAYNPYFIYYDIDGLPPENMVKNIQQFGVCLHNAGSQINVRSKAHRLINDTTYEQYAFKNVSMKDSNSLIAIRSVNGDFLFNISVLSYKLSVYSGMDGLIYISDKGILEDRTTYILNPDDMTENGILAATNLKTRYSFRMDDLYKYFTVGRVRFSSVAIKGIMLEVFKKKI
jgi:hypothetical protein